MATPSTTLQVGLYALAFHKLKFSKELKQSSHPYCEKTTYGVKLSNT